MLTLFWIKIGHGATTTRPCHPEQTWANSHFTQIVFTKVTWQVNAYICPKLLFGDVTVFLRPIWVSSLHHLSELVDWVFVDDMQGAHPSVVACFVLCMCCGKVLIVRISSVTCRSPQNDNFCLQSYTKPLTYRCIVAIAGLISCSNKLWVCIVDKRSYSFRLTIQIELNCCWQTLDAKHFWVGRWHPNDTSLEGLAKTLHGSPLPGRQIRLLALFMADYNFAVIPYTVRTQINVVNFLFWGDSTYGKDLQRANRNLLLYGAWRGSLQTFIPVSKLTGILGSEPCRSALL